jgi:hypothetical protein
MDLQSLQAQRQIEHRHHQLAAISAWFSLLDVAFLGAFLLIAGIGCTTNRSCRDGTIALRIEFIPNLESMDGLAINYRLDNQADLNPLYPISAPLNRPSLVNHGVLEIIIANYASHKTLTLNFVPLKGNLPVGDWQDEVIRLDAHCTQFTLRIVAKTGNPHDASSNNLPDSLIIRSLDTSTDNLKERNDLVPSVNPSDSSVPSDISPRPSIPDAASDTALDILSTRDMFSKIIDSSTNNKDAPLVDTMNGNVDAIDQSMNTEVSSVDPNSTCPLGQSMCTTNDVPACVDTTIDPDHCGMCGTPCRMAGKECCGGSCIYIATYQHDPANCGRCGNACKVPSDVGYSCLIFDLCQKPTCGKDSVGTTVCNPGIDCGDACKLGQECSANTCICTKQSCPNGCCKDHQCLAGNNSIACGYGGENCVKCATNSICMPGEGCKNDFSDPFGGI